MADGEIRAAGVVCLREHPVPDGEAAGTEVLVVHRARQRDWSLPKGKLEPGEHHATAAVRETREETGFDVVLGPALRTQRYLVAGRPKAVRYWLAHATGRGLWEPNHEIADVRWVPVGEAAALLTYPADTSLLATATTSPRGTLPFVLLRHAQAEKRIDYADRHGGEPPHDALRPLTRIGESQALDLVPLLSAFGISRVHSSDTMRCLDTVRPFARAHGSEIVPEPLLSEHGFAQDPGAALDRVSLLLAQPTPLVLCTHRPVLPELLQRIRLDTGLGAVDPGLAPGGCYVLHRTVAADGVRVPVLERHLP